MPALLHLDPHVDRHLILVDLAAGEGAALLDHLEPAQVALGLGDLRDGVGLLPTPRMMCVGAQGFVFISLATARARPLADRARS